MELLLGPQSQEDKDIGYAAMPTWMTRALKLYNRCRMFNEIALPFPGGVLDQGEMTCSILEVIHYKHQQIMNERMESVTRRNQQNDGKSMDSVNIGKPYSRRTTR